LNNQPCSSKLSKRLNKKSRSSVNILDSAGNQPQIKPQINQGSQRRPDLDWLRILGVLLLVPFHAALVFDLNPLHVVYLKDSLQNEFLAQIAGLISRWHMPLLFVIAGAATWFALGRRSGRQYLGERIVRLLVPAVIGLIILIPWMTNIHWLGQPGAPSPGQIYSAFFTLNASDTAGIGGTFTPAHLWFIIFLFVFSLLGLPLFLVLRWTSLQRILAALASWSGAVYLLFIPMAAVSSINILGDKNPLYFFLVFVSGYLILANPRFQIAIDRQIYLSLILAVVSTSGSWILLGGHLQPWSSSTLAGNILYQLSRWTWILFILGAGHLWLNRENRVLQYTREAAYPFYILHLPVLTLVTWWVIRLDLNVFVKYALIVTVTVLLTFIVYDLIVKRINLLRFCFGMKLLQGKILRMPGGEIKSG
jgi:glucans biosynthesis protein C